MKIIALSEDDDDDDKTIGQRMIALTWVSIDPKQLMSRSSSDILQ